MAEGARVEVVSGVLELDALLAEIEHVAAVVHGFGADRVLVEHWWGSEDLPVEGLAAALAAGFVDAQYPDLGFRVGLGVSDFTVTAPGTPIEIEICHHYEVHVVTDSTGLAEALLARWRELGYSPRGPSRAPAEER